MIVRLLLIISFVLLASCDGRKGPRTDRVSMHLFIQSKCERAAEIVATLEPILTNMEGSVDLRIDYIGREEDGRLTSLLGESEIEGDMWELCVRDQKGSDEDSIRLLRFVRCMGDNRRKIPDTWESCAKISDIDASAAKSCVDGKQGRALLRDSFKTAAENRATRSPTVVIADKPYAGLLTEPSLGRALCDAIPQNKPAYCSHLPAPIRVSVTVVGDARCKDRSCDTKRIIETISKTLEGAEVTSLDYSDPEGRALFEKTEERHLPIIVFSADVVKDKKGYERLMGYLHPVEGSSDWVYPVGAVWDPTMEICNDGKDNDGNGSTDCEDSTCAERKECRPEIENKLTLFAMPQCSFSIRADRAAAEVLRNFNTGSEKIDFSIDYVGSEVNGAFSAMHGSNEVEEALRRVCAEKHYKKSDRFMEYILCRDQMFLKNKGREVGVDAWSECAKNGVGAAVIRKCAATEEGRMLLSDSFKRSAALGITGAPRWIVNDKYEVTAASAEEVKREFCARNENRKGCQRSLPNEKTFSDYCGGRPKAKQQP